MAKKDKELHPIFIAGPFVRQTFIRIAIEMKYTKKEAEANLDKLIRSGKVVECGLVGLSKEIQSYTFKN